MPNVSRPVFILKSGGKSCRGELTPSQERSITLIALWWCEQREPFDTSRAKLDDIAYHAILAELPVAAIRTVVERAPGSLAGVEPIMHIRPQSVVTGIDTCPSSNDLRLFGLWKNGVSGSVCGSI